MSTNSAGKYLEEIFEKAKQARNKESEMMALAGIGRFFLQNSSFDSASIYNKKALKLAIELNDQISIIYQLIEIADADYNLAKFDSALQFLAEADKLIDTTTYYNLRASYFNLLGNVNMKLGLIKESLEAYLHEVAIFEEMDDEHSLAVVFNNLGNVFRSIGDKQKTVEYLNRAATINNRQGNQNDLAMNYSNLGVFYLETDSNTAAIAYFDKAIRIAKKTNNFVLMAQNYLNMGNANKQLGEYHIASCYYDSVNVICKKIGMEYGLLLVKINLGDLNTHLGNYPLAEKLLDEALDDAKNKGLIDEEKNIYQYLATLYKQNGSYEKALAYSELYVKYNDSLLNETNNRVVQELIMKSEREQNEKEMLKLNSQIEKSQSDRKIIIITSLCIILALMLLVWFFLYTKRKAYFEKELADKEHENLILSNELNEQELALKALNMAHTAETIDNIKDQLSILNETSDGELKTILVPLIKVLQKESSSKPFEEFTVRFEKLHQKFYTSLSQKYPQLSATEVSICGYLRMNLSTKDIAALTKRSSRTITTHRYNIRTKLGIPTDTGLVSFLLSI